MTNVSSERKFGADAGLYLASIVLASIALAAGAAAQDKAPIIIGLHTPITGTSSEIGLGGQYGAQLAISEINAHGGINGREIRLVVADDKSTPDGAITAIQRLASTSGVQLLWNTSSSTPTVAVVARAKNGPLPYFVSFASDPRVLHPFSKYVFSGAALPVENVVSSMASFIADKLKARSFAMLSCDQANCKTSVPLLKTALKDRGIRIAAEETYHSGDVDFTGQINAIKSANPDVVQVWGLTADGGRIAALLRRAGVTAKIVGDTGVADQSVIELAGGTAEGMYATWIGGPQFISDENGPMGEWRRKFATAFPHRPTGLPNTYSARAYADAYVIAEGFRRSDADASPESLIRHLEEVQEFVAGKDAYFKYASPIGFPRTFATTDHQGSRTVVIVTVKDGRFVSLPQ